MLYLIIAIIICLIFTFFCFKFGNDNGILGLFVIGFFSAITSLILAIYIGVAGWFYTAAKYKADIINKEYDKKYTQEEIFYADDVIDTIRQLDRQRVEINGNILKDK